MGPCEEVSGNLPVDERGPGRALENRELELLLNTARSKPGWEVAYFASVISANSTARSIEVKSLRLRDVDLINGEFHIRRSKKKSSHRTIPLNPATMWAFTRLIERFRALGGTDDSHFLLPFDSSHSKTNRGRGFDFTRHQKSWTSAWRSLIKETAKRAGADGDVFRGLRYHDLRHFSITVLSESGAADKTVQQLAGHLTEQMQRHYSHLRNTAARKAMKP